MQGPSEVSANTFLNSAGTCQGTHSNDSVHVFGQDNYMDQCLVGQPQAVQVFQDALILLKFLGLQVALYATLRQ